MQMITDYSAAFKQLKKQMKWKVSDKRILMMIAGLYVSKNKPLQVNHFLEVAEQLKKQAGLFSPVRSNYRYTAAAMLDTNFDQPLEKIEPLFDLYNLLISSGFKRGTFTYIAASVMLTNKHKNADTRIQAEKANAIYRRMKKEHSILTSNSDYPLATLLAYEEGSVDELVARMEQIYNKLSQSGFRKGNNLQFLSHILTIDGQLSSDMLVNQASTVLNKFKQADIAPKGKYYPVIGMLALLPAAEFNMENVLQLYDSLYRDNQFKRQKSMNLLTAVNFFISGKLANSSIAETSMYTTLEVIMQAQQAAMIAAVAGSSAAAASSGSS